MLGRDIKKVQDRAVVQTGGHESLVPGGEQIENPLHIQEDFPRRDAVRQNANVRISAQPVGRRHSRVDHHGPPQQMLRKGEIGRVDDINDVVHIRVGLPADEGIVQTGVVRQFFGKIH